MIYFLEVHKELNIQTQILDEPEPLGKIIFATTLR